MKIDLRSDTVTRPSAEMRQAMANALVGDDVMKDDPTVNELETRMAKMFGKEAALFCASGTMSNQIAIKAHTQPGDEIICHKYSHIYYYEGGGASFISGVSTCLLDGEMGQITAKDVQNHINPTDDPHRPLTSMVGVENTMNKGGGSIYNFHELVEIGKVCKTNNLKYHLDGARIFNALIETTEKSSDYGEIFDSISVCFSKGLGAPVGSILIGDKPFINKALRVRKALGGGMRQSGILAAACIYAIENNIERLKKDHENAKILASEIEHLPYVESIMPVHTNIIYFNLKPEFCAVDLMKYLEKNDIFALSLSNNQLRFVTHLDISDEMINRTIEVLKLYG